MKSHNRVPSFLKRVLWSYDVSKMSLNEDKETIITQVLNYGDLKAVKWLYSVYGEDQIKYVVSHPKRGLWFEKVLNFWEKMFGFRLPADVRKRAIFTL